jgi:hypothetical protein
VVVALRCLPLGRWRGGTSPQTRQRRSLVQVEGSHGARGWERSDRAGQDLSGVVRRRAGTGTNRAGAPGRAGPGEGCVVLEVNGKHVLISKVRIDVLVEVE